MPRRSTAAGLTVALALVLASGTSGAGPSRTSPEPAGSEGYVPHRRVVPEAEAPRACEQQTLIGTLVAKRVTARRSPDGSSRGVATFARINAQGARRVFDLVSEARDGKGTLWYRALLPVRPNGTIGFIPARALALSRTPYRLDVYRSRLQLTVRKGCAVVETYRIGLGTRDTPTPVGAFYLVALVKPPTSDSVYGTYAYGLSAYSDALTNWTGGGIIGLHGTNDPSSIGQRKSHGCIRMRNLDIEHLTRILPLGTPIEIH